MDDQEESWVIIDFECFENKDDCVIINFVVKEDKNEFKHLESVKKFLSDIETSYDTKEGIVRQARIDIPRQQCFINDVEVKTYSDFIKEIEYTKLLKETILLCTQASLFPITFKLFEEYQDPENNIHVVDFTDDNPIIFNFWILGKDQMRVEIRKKFRVMKVDHNKETVLRTLATNIVLELGSEHDTVNYSVMEKTFRK
jgi:hypothetical protein